MKPSKQQIHASNKLGLTTSNNKIYRQNIRPRTRAFQSCMALAYTIHWPSTVQHKKGRSSRVVGFYKPPASVT